MRAYVQAQLVDREALDAAQEANDAIEALQLLKRAFTTDVAPILAMARHRAGGAIDPVAAYRASGYRQRCAAERGSPCGRAPGSSERHGSPAISPGVDLGAGSGRAVLGCLGASGLELHEVHRFTYPPRRIDGHLRWDAVRLFGGRACQPRPRARDRR